MSRRLACVVAGVAGLLTACSVVDDGLAPDTSQAEAPTTSPRPAESLPAYPVSDYSYTLRRSCFCADGGVPVVVTVRDGAVVEAVYARRGLGHAAGAPAARWNRMTINDVVHEAKEARAQGAHVVRVRWPSGQDHPTSVWIDHDANAVDDEIGYAISNVSPG